MAATSARALRLLSVLGIGLTLTAEELAGRLEVSRRTVRRDIETLRDLGYDIEAPRGLGGGYRLGGGAQLPPVVFDEDQAMAAALALQTAPAVLEGIREHAERALSTLHRSMPRRSRLLAEAFTVSSARNYWEFPAAAIDAELVRAFGVAIARHHIVRIEDPEDPGESSLDLEPHHLVIWAARWYLVAYECRAERWRALRLDGLRPEGPSHRPFEPRQMPSEDPGEFVMTHHDRGDRLAAWPCRGAATMPVPPDVVARYAPGGSVVEDLGAGFSRLSLGAWSWVGLGGLLVTFDAELTDVEPAELRAALRRIARRLGEGTAER